MEYHNDDVLRILPHCGHSFHVTCIDIWLQQHSTCPVCRISLREFSDRKRTMQPLFSSAIRSDYGAESFDSHSCLYHLTRHGSRTSENHGTDPIQEDHLANEGDRAETVEKITPITEGNHNRKELANKHVESPSNS